MWIFHDIPWSSDLCVGVQYTGDLAAHNRELTRDSCRHPASSSSCPLSNYTLYPYPYLHYTHPTIYITFLISPLICLHLTYYPLSQVAIIFNCIFHRLMLSGYVSTYLPRRSGTLQILRFSLHPLHTVYARIFQYRIDSRV